MMSEFSKKRTSGADSGEPVTQKKYKTMAIFSRIRMYRPASREQICENSLGECEDVETPVQEAEKEETNKPRASRQDQSEIRKGLHESHPRPSEIRYREVIQGEEDIWTAPSKEIQDSEGVLEHEEEEELGSLIPSVLSTIRHFFGSFFPLFNKVKDPRDPRRVKYPMKALSWACILMFLCGLGSRRQIGLLLRNRTSVKNYLTLFGIDGFPHGDTLDDTFSKVESGEFQEIVCTMTEILIRKKVLYPYRLLGRYYVVAIDGTGVITFRNRHCPHCLTRTHKGVTLYYHNVLEAKIVTPNGFAFSLMTEFIENAGEYVSKQDCELRAFYRLAERLKERFPHLPICLSLDGLFAGGPTFKICRKYGWEFVIVLKDDSLPSVNQEFASLCQMETGNHLTWLTGKNGEVRQDLRWINDIQYVDTNKDEHTLSVLECLETKPDKGEKKTKKFKWLISRNVTDKNAVAIANSGGRDRWKVENQGFNVQKNGVYGLEHAYSENTNSFKVFYFLMQMAHMIAQLLLKGNLLKNVFPRGCGSAMNLARFILEAWRTIRLTCERMQEICNCRFQIRFNSS